MYGNEMNQNRIYRKFESPDGKVIEVFAHGGIGKHSISTIITTIEKDKTERSLSVSIKDDFDKCSLEIWDGIKSPTLRKYQRQYYTELSTEVGTQAIREFFSNIAQVYNNTSEVLHISEKLIEFSNLIREEKQKTLHATPN
jgi:hypothetical protein